MPVDFDENVRPRPFPRGIVCHSGYTCLRPRSDAAIKEDLLRNKTLDLLRSMLIADMGALLEMIGVDMGR